MQFGSQINPAYGNVDWSNLVNAGQMKAAGMSALGQGINSAVGSITDAIKQKQAQQKEDEKLAKAGAMIAKVLGKSAPGMIPDSEGLQAFLDDKDIPLSERANQAGALMTAIQTGLSLQQEQRLQQMAGLDQARLMQEVIKSQMPSREQMQLESEASDFFGFDMPSGIGGDIDPSLLPDLGAPPIAPGTTFEQATQY